MLLGRSFQSLLGRPSTGSGLGRKLCLLLGGIVTGLSSLIIQLADVNIYILK
jgi:hypothetical protein